MSGITSVTISKVDPSDLLKPRTPSNLNMAINPSNERLYAKDFEGNIIPLETPPVLLDAQATNLPATYAQGQYVINYALSSLVYFDAVFAQFQTDNADLFATWTAKQRTQIIWQVEFEMSANPLFGTQGSWLIVFFPNHINDTTRLNFEQNFSMAVAGDIGLVGRVTWPGQTTSAPIIPKVGISIAGTAPGTGTGQITITAALANSQ